MMTRHRGNRAAGGRAREGRPSRLAPALAIVAACLLTLLLAASSSAAAPDLLLRLPEGRTAPGEGAAQLDNPAAAAANPTTGHIYISEGENNRISEYTAWGYFVRSWGWDVAPEGAPGDTPSDQLESCGPPAPEASPSSSLCQKGSEGTGAGQFKVPGGIAVDQAGDVYVYDRENLRLQKFSPSGQFLLMAGGEVDKTTSANLCTKADLEAGDECGAGLSGTASGFFSNGSIADFIAYSPGADAIAVGDKGRIELFDDLDGSFLEEIPLLGELSGKTVSALDVDAAGNYYLSVSGIDTAYKLSAVGSLLHVYELTILNPHPENPNVLALANSADGTLYVGVRNFTFTIGQEVLGFDPKGDPIAGMEAGDQFASLECEQFPQFCGFGFPTDLRGLTSNHCAGSEGPNLYAIRNLSSAFGNPDSPHSYVSAYGPGPIGCEDPPVRPPLIVDQYAASVDTAGATVRAAINPRFWPDATYYVQYGTGKCSEGGCDQSQPAPPGSLLTAKSVNAPITSKGVFLGGLQPDTTYHFRFVAQSGGGGPVTGEEESFTTFALPSEPEPCPNDAYRTAASARLPDCRAYELVSPLEKNSGDATLTGQFDGINKFGELSQSAASGDRFTYSSATPFGNVEGAPSISQYLASRGPDGWSNASLNYPRTTTVILDVIGNEYQAFAPELCQAWLFTNSEPLLAPEAVPGYANLYQRQSCTGPSGYEPLTTVKPEQASESFAPSEVGVQAFSADLTYALFNASAKLSNDAPAEPASCTAGVGGCILRLYLHTAGNPDARFVCRLPDGKPITEACAVGTAGQTIDDSSAQNALSADGREAYWTAWGGGFDSANTPGWGKIYVRENPAATQSKLVSGKCSESARACTYPVSETVSASRAHFWGASQDGSAAIFEIGEAGSSPLGHDLYRFDLQKAKQGEEASSLIAGQVDGVLGLSQDANRVYFLSREDRDQGGPAAAGELNLYLFEAAPSPGEGPLTFIATLASKDGIDVAAPRPFYRLARVSANGLHAAFVSAASLTGYDNTDATSGKPDQEVYLYDAQERKLRCASCNPSGARPVGENIGGGVNQTWTAARIHTWERSTYGSRQLSDDGSRLFFESIEALVSRDANGNWDVYQWEQSGTGSCTISDSTYSQDAEGCIELISSGKSPAGSYFLDADPEGKNVFIATQAGLLPQDYGLNDVYVARVGGGYPPPGSPPAPCEGEACQGPYQPPTDATPASSSFEGAGNVPEGPTPCRRRGGSKQSKSDSSAQRAKRKHLFKGKVRRKGKCIKKVRHERNKKHRGKHHTKKGSVHS